MQTIYESIDAISEELSSLIALYFDETVYNDIDFESDAFKRRMKRGLFDLLHEANRKDLPDHVKVPFLNWLIKQTRYEAYESGVLIPDETTISTVKPVQSTSIKSTSVTYGQSDAELLHDDRKELYTALASELDDLWARLVVSIRRLRW